MPQFREGPQCSRHLTLAEIRVIPVSPALGGSPEEMISWGIRMVWGGALGDKQGSVQSCTSTLVLHGYARLPRKPVIKVDRPDGVKQSSWKGKRLSELEEKLCGPMRVGKSGAWKVL